MRAKPGKHFGSSLRATIAATRLTGTDRQNAFSVINHSDGPRKSAWAFEFTAAPKPCYNPPKYLTRGKRQCRDDSSDELWINSPTYLATQAAVNECNNIVFGQSQASLMFNLGMAALNSSPAASIRENKTGSAPRTPLMMAQPAVISNDARGRKGQTGKKRGCPDLKRGKLSRSPFKSVHTLAGVKNGPGTASDNRGQSSVGRVTNLDSMSRKRRRMVIAVQDEPILDEQEWSALNSPINSMCFEEVARERLEDDWTILLPEAAYSPATKNARRECT
jgi:hypothetical protein